jgi:hypothetical protein
MTLDSNFTLTSAGSAEWFVICKETSTFGDMGI